MPTPRQNRVQKLWNTILPARAESSHPQCPYCGCELAPPPIVDGERYPPVFVRHNCECGYTFESERVVRYISRPMEERK